MVQRAVRLSSAAVLLLIVSSCLGPSAGSAAAAPADSTSRATAAPVSKVLPDQTRMSHWTLPNGLRVVTRSIPKARSAAVTLSFRLGSREDPTTHEGFAELAAQVAYTGRCGDLPSRSMIEMDQLRPGGWSLTVGPHLVEMTEACPLDLLPGVLHQVCQRLKGVAVDDSLVRTSREQVQRRLRRNYDTQPFNTLHYLSGEIAAGRPAEAAMRYASGDGLQSVTARQIREILAARLVPANAVLCVVGNLDRYPLATLIEKEMAGIPPGKAAPPPPWGHEVGGNAALKRPDIDRMMSTVAIITPALTDTLHPYFVAFTVSAAGALRQYWAKFDSTTTTRRFRYSIATDPELARFYPPFNDRLPPMDIWKEFLDRTGEAIADSTSIQSAAEDMLWLTGGPIPPELRERAETDPTVIHTLAQTLAAIESFGDAAFWDAYRVRLMRASSHDLGPLFRWFDDPKRRVVLVIRPGG